ncbi:MAG: hypothetical protein V4721_10525 [Bacteroidota bacterium]
MSRIDPEQNRPINPARHFFEWSGKDGELTYYDKEKTRPDVAEIEAQIANLTASLATTPDVAKKAVNDIINDLKKKKDSHNIPVKTPFTFIVLDRMITLGGYNKSESIGYYSNEIKKDELKTAIFKVRSKNGAEAEGLYENIKGKLSGLKYTEVVYIAFVEEKEFHIGAIRMSGSSLTAWFNYVNGEVDPKTKKRISSPNDPYKGAVVLSKGEELINGETRYYPPMFIQKEIKPETEQKAIDLTITLSEYHKAYFAYQWKDSTVGTEETAAPETSVAETIEEPKAETRSAKEIAMEKQAAVSSEADPFDDDLPF